MVGLSSDAAGAERGGVAERAADVVGVGHAFEHKDQIRSIGDVAQRAARQAAPPGPGTRDAD